MQLRDILSKGVRLMRVIAFRVDMDIYQYGWYRGFLKIVPVTVISYYIRLQGFYFL